ncbi:MAG: type IV secretory system conjugative DNA transfer family protein [Polyangiaceae bacterium]
MRVFVALGVVVFVAGLWASTQYLAAHLHGASGLGVPWGHVGGVCVYAPWAWVRWRTALAVRSPEVFRVAGAMTALGAVLGALIGVSGAWIRLGPSVPVPSSRRRRWATVRDLQQAGLLCDRGVVLGETGEDLGAKSVDGPKQETVEKSTRRRLVRHDGPEHVLCFAATRSGQAAELVVPTLLSWGESAIVIDLHDENWARTADSRGRFSGVWRFEPTAADSARFNPLLEIRSGTVAVKDAQNVAALLLDRAADDERRNHLAAQDLLVGVILHVLHAEADKTLAGVATFLSSADRSAAGMLRRMLESSQSPTGPQGTVARIAREMLQKTESELAGAMATASSFLDIYRDPIVARSTSTSDFRIADLMNAEVPTSLYVVVRPPDLDRVRPVVRLFLGQVVQRLTASTDWGELLMYRHRLLLLVDGFPLLGRIDAFQAALPLMAGHGVKAFLTAQSADQLERTYGADSSILDHCHVRIAFVACDDPTAKRICDLLATEADRKVHRSDAGLVRARSRRAKEQHHLRQTMAAAEMPSLSPDEALLFVGGLPPYRARRLNADVGPRFDAPDALSAAGATWPVAPERVRGPGRWGRVSTASR